MADPIDYQRLFAKTVEEMLVEVFDRHGIDQLYEDELEAIVKECTDRCYHQSIGEFRRRQGLSVFRQLDKQLKMWWM